jgi:hypothetical protein
MVTKVMSFCAIPQVLAFLKDCIVFAPRRSAKPARARGGR